MFSQFRHAVEQLAQQVPVPGQHDDSNGTGEQRRGSLDMRRSLSQQSGDSPSPTNGRGSVGSPGTGSTRGLSLEERLKRAAAAKATAASSDPLNADGSSSPDSGRKTRDSTSPSPAMKAQHRRTMSPASTPLPDSPALMARRDSFMRTSSNLGKSESAAIPDLELDGKGEGADVVKHDLAVEPSATEVANVGQGSVETKEMGEEEKELNAEEKKDGAAPPTPRSDSPAGSEVQPSVQDGPPTSSSPPPAAVDLPSEPSRSSASPTPEDPPVQSRPEDADTREAIVVSSSESHQGPDAEEKAGKLANEDPELDSKSQTIPVQSQSENDFRSLRSASGTEIEELQQRLKQVEQRFADVSTSFKRLQAEKVTADAVLRDLTPIDTIQDSPGLRDYLSNLNSKQEIFQNEIKLLNGKLSGYEERLEGLRDVHRLESKSQTDQIDKLATQLQETEALFQASERAIAEAEGKFALDQTDTNSLKTEIERYKTIAKEEEEKRVKAVSLLKTVRQKLVKAEKEKEDAFREVAVSRDRDRGEKETDRIERLKLQQELEMMQIEREKMAIAQKAQFERELALQKERYEREMAAVKGQLELEIITLKSSRSKELSAKSSQITTLENSLNSVIRDKNVFFEQLQIKQAETESAQSHLESLQHQNTELEFQLREANERLALIKEEYADYQREQEVRAREPVTSASDIAQMISAAEAKYEVKLAESRRSVAVLEKERGESEANWSRKLKEKVKELEDLKSLLGSAARSREEDVSAVEALKTDLGRAREEARILKEQLLDVPVLQETIQDLKNGAKEQEEELRQKTSALERLAEEHKSREAQLKQANKTLREELRKVQSSAALLERQRNPGVGYWNRVGDASGDGQQSPTVSTTNVASGGGMAPRPASPAPSASSVSTANKAEEEVNLEYLRNVILQFLEHKEMRPNLVKVISIILHFTPQETRRLVAKV